MYKSHQPARRQGMLLKCPTNDHKNLKVFVAGILNKNIIESAQAIVSSAIWKKHTRVSTTLLVVICTLQKQI